MTNKKQRMSLLDNLAGAAAPTPASIMPGNRALRAARDAVDAHRVWELDPDHIDIGDRIRDRLDESGLEDLRDAIEQNGQTVPILVRRDPARPDRYLLVYGYRRLMAIRASEKISTIRALVASMGDDDALRAQISENMARRDLSYIEKALFARELVDSGFGTQAQVAEVLTVTKSSVSMALTVIEQVGADLVRAIGPAYGVGRPRWEAMGRTIDQMGADRAALAELAERERAMAYSSAALAQAQPEDFDPSVAAFEAVQAALPQPGAPARPAAKKPAPAPRRISLADDYAARVSRNAKGLRLDLAPGEFADWMEQEAGVLLYELYQRWQDQGR
ncbi:MAG: plasmid partitioning protein RepB [Paracoccus sp.]|nr:plasmid partitioning protein RepB [Paracoccus sp. (in: a-proteobacteria)]